MEKIISLAHGNGGKLTQELIRNIFLPYLNNPFLAPLADSAVFEVKGTKLAFTTDSYVIKPLFFPGGDIGKLSVSGTINDLAVVGAKPAFISCGFIIEEGVSISTLKKILLSIKKTAQQAGVDVATGDTKVVEKGSADGIFINTSGIGFIPPEMNLGLEKVKVGDYIIVNGTIGDHSVAVLSQREELGFDEAVNSDCAPLYDLVQKLKPYWESIKFMRDPTRGGIAGILNEIVQGKNFGVQLWEKNIPFREETITICEFLGMDPLYLANEGKILFFTEPEKTENILQIIQTHPLGKKAAIIGKVVANPSGKVYLKTSIGTKRIIDMLVEAQLPRIC